MIPVLQVGTGAGGERQRPWDHTHPSEEQTAEPKHPALPDSRAQMPKQDGILPSPCCCSPLIKSR